MRVPITADMSSPVAAGGRAFQNRFMHRQNCSPASNRLFHKLVITPFYIYYSKNHKTHALIFFLYYFIQKIDRVKKQRRNKIFSAGRE